LVRHLPEEELRVLIRGERDGRMRERLIFIMSLYEGESVECAARKLGRVKATAYSWLRRWNQGGAEGLRPDFSKAGRPSKLSAEEREELRLRRSQPLSAVGLIQAACVDGTDLPAWSSRDPHDTRHGLGDPDARMGRGKKGFILGYQSLFLVDIEGFSLGHVEAPANVNEKELVEKPLDGVLGECIEVELLAADSQFEAGRVEALLEWAMEMNLLGDPNVILKLYDEA